MPKRSRTSPTSGPLRATSRRVTRTGSCSRPKQGSKRMLAVRLRFPLKYCFGICLAAALGAPALAGSALNLRNAQVELLSFTALDGWKDDDHATAFDTFLKSCRAIVNAPKAARVARPFANALFKVCERAAAAG